MIFFKRHIFAVLERTVQKMENIIKRKQSLEEEIKLLEWLLACEHRRDMRNKIIVYTNQIKRELIKVYL
jgi:hypothetical protein